VYEQPGRQRSECPLGKSQVDQAAPAIKAFYGTSENAVKTQIWIAASVYVLVAILRKRLGLPLAGSSDKITSHSR